MKTIKKTILASDLKKGMFEWAFPENKEIDLETVHFKTKDDIMCGSINLFKKDERVPFYVSHHAWMEAPKSVVLDFRKNDCDLESIDSKIIVLMKYETMTKKKKKECEKKWRERVDLANKKAKDYPSRKQVERNIIILCNNAVKRHHLSSDDNLEELLKTIDYSLIICSSEINAKYNITPLCNVYLPSELILCIKPNMTSELIIMEGLSNS